MKVFIITVPCSCEKVSCIPARCAIDLNFIHAE